MLANGNYAAHHPQQHVAGGYPLPNSSARNHVNMGMNMKMFTGQQGYPVHMLPYTGKRQGKNAQNASKEDNGRVSAAANEKTKDADSVKLFVGQVSAVFCAHARESLVIFCILNARAYGDLEAKNLTGSGQFAHQPHSVL